MKFRCAVIGCGRIGCGFDEKGNTNLIRTHAKSYLKNSKTQLTALADIDSRKLKKYGKIFNVKNLYLDPSLMLEKENLDCVSICTHASSHLHLTEKAIKNRVKAVIVEKPISDSLTNARKIIQICKKNNVILGVNHQRRFDPFYHSLAKFIRKKMKKIQNSRVIYGGGITNTGSHLFDVLRLFFGEPSSIQAYPSQNKSHNPKDPNLDAIVDFKNGVRCNLFAVDTKNYGVFEIDMLGIDKRIRLNMITNDISFYSKGVGIQDYNTLKLKKNPFLSKRNATDIRLTINNVVDCLDNGTKPLSSGMDGYNSLELIVASRLSARNKKKMKFPLKNKNY